MRNNALWLTVALWAMQSSFITPYKRDDQLYIQQYKDIAIQEMQRTGIPASIKLAQAIQESGAGTSELSVQANNHFGIKCGSDWTGATYGRIDDDSDVFGNPIESCFRVYSNAEQSFIAHSAFLTDPKKQARYGFLFQIPATDYREWAKGLLKAGYATDPSYADRLINLIERYQLHQYDFMANHNSPTTAAPIAAGYRVTNDVKYVLTQPNETLAQLAQRTGTSLNNLLEYNEMLSSSSSYLPAGTKIYIQHKRNYYRGGVRYHTVSSGETMLDIAQLYGVKLDRLLERNLLERGVEPAAGASIKLRGSKVSERPNVAMRTQQPLLPDLDYLFDKPITPVSVTDPIPSSRTEESFDGPDRFAKPENITIPTPSVSSAAPYYIVKAGDTLWNISQRYKTTVEELKRLNNLKSNDIRLGMQLRVQ